MTYTHKLVVLERFINDLSEEHRKALETLMFDEALMLSERDDEVTVWLCVNDIFYYAADAEDVEIKELPLLAEIYDKFGWDGLIAWVAIKRGMEPLRRKFDKTVEYKSAVKFIEQKKMESS